MKEEWRDVPDYPGYQVSNLGRVRSFWHKQKRFGSWGGTERVLVDEPYILPQSDDGNGYMKVLVNNGEHRACKKVHRMVAEAFIPNPKNLETVDHIKSGSEGKLDNSVRNLRWVTRRANIQKAYKDGMCDNRIEASKKRTMCIDLWTNERTLYDSIGDASYATGVERSCISRARSSDREVVCAKHYMFYEPSAYEVFEYRSTEDYYGGMI